MKKLLICFSVLAFSVGSGSCIVVAPHDNGKHKGWYKNPHNPHNPAHTDVKKGNNGNGNGKKKNK